MMHYTHKIGSTSLSLALLFAAAALSAADWPAYRGPFGNGITAETLTPWPASGPKQIWKVPTPRGFSSFSVAGGRVYTQIVGEGQGGAMEQLVAMDANTGKALWRFDIGPAVYDRGGDDGAPDNRGGDGPRSTPAVSGNRVYVFSQDLVLSCVDAATGKKVWSKDILKEFQGRNIGWKSAMSPVVDGDFVYVAGGGPGASMLAFHKNTGQLLWKTGNERITHATPVVATIHGVRQIIYFMQSGLVSVSVVDGRELWRFPYKFNVSTAASPVVCDDIVYCSAGYGVGGGACRITKEGSQLKAVPLWQVPGDTKVANHWSTPVYKDGHLYGMFSFKQYGRGPLKCVDVKTGQIKWEQPGFGAGHIILAGNKLVALADDGQVVLVEPAPEGYKELARYKAVTGKCWTTPALSNGRLYLRSTVEGVCLEVK
ncbi:PQQ-like beta-propeller repeat protein [Fontisphaera persica]|uniref:PQQ-binding-like beta-propeller repeat protein n=1 Tax=Fontisphaera persica TaxID=2974023 RepID=UPI0024C0D3F5|nr:PQQ-binding-like beta-propeller repeat protein [Fontisphaera persica]WCJ58300.1 PQQ-like beta-propeller repeat protein [Fontisphaera persica]